MSGIEASRMYQKGARISFSFEIISAKILSIFSSSVKVLQLILREFSTFRKMEVIYFKIILHFFVSQRRFEKLKENAEQ